MASKHMKQTLEHALLLDRTASGVWKEEMDRFNAKSSRIFSQIGPLSVVVGGFHLVVTAQSGIQDLPVILFHALAYYGLCLLLCGALASHPTLLSYLVQIPAYLVGIWMSAIVNPDLTGFSILAMLCVYPLFLFDHSWRVSLFELSIAVVYLAVYGWCKPLSYFQHELLHIVIVLVFSWCGEMFVLFTRLRSLEEGSYDPLTRLYNRKGFDEAVKRARFQQAVYVSCDMDDFKTFNDRYGHELGDQLLKSFTKELNALAGEKGIVARNGGDEFQFLLVDPKADWNKRLEDFFTHPHQLGFDGKTYPYLASAGYVCYPGQTTQFHDVFQMADLALYHAKMTRGVQLSQYDPSMEHENRTQYSFSAKDLAGALPGALCIFTADKDERILFANQACVELFACPTFDEFMELTGGRFPNMIHPDDLASAQEAIKVRQPGSLSYRIVGKGGVVKHVSHFGKLVSHLNYGAVFCVFLTERVPER